MPDDPAARPAARPRTRRRDRRGRGLRGPLSLQDLPVLVSRSARFDGLVLDAVDRLEKRWPQLADVDFIVEDVPPADTSDWSAEPVPLGRTIRGKRHETPRIVIYRRPVEARADNPSDLGLLVHEVVVEEVAELLGQAPESIDPSYGDR